MKLKKILSFPGYGATLFHSPSYWFKLVAVRSSALFSPNPVAYPPTVNTLVSEAAKAACVWECVVDSVSPPKGSLGSKDLFSIYFLLPLFYSYLVTGLVITQHYKIVINTETTTTVASKIAAHCAKSDKLKCLGCSWIELPRLFVIRSPDCLWILRTVCYRQPIYTPQNHINTKHHERQWDR